MELRRIFTGILAMGCLGAACAFAEGLADRTPVLLIGDSMMKLPGFAMERELAKLPGIEAHSYAGIGTGLARLDAFDWMAKIDELCAAQKPRVAVVALGANDRQPMLLSEGRGVVQPGTSEWEEEYGRRLGLAMDRLHDGGCRQIIWLRLPPMRDPAVNEFAQRINELVSSQAACRPFVRVHDFNKLVADRRTGGFTERMMDPQTAAPIHVRERDGIHLSPEGSRILAMALIEEYWK